MLKRKILFHSNYHGQLTGFGKNAKNFLAELYKTGLFEIVELANGYKKTSPQFNLSPWKIVGTIPDSDQEGNEWIQKYPAEQREFAVRRAAYGDILVDQIIAEEKPDIYICAEDIWAVSPYIKKPWWNKITCVVWTTIDSLPLLPEAIEVAKSTKHFYVWSTFAEKEFHKLGLKHVKTLRGTVDPRNFYKLTDLDRKSLRKNAGLFNDFIVGFVFRNQLRKSVYTLIEAISILKKRNLDTDFKALLVTNFAEPRGWPILRLAEEYGVQKNILSAYVCSRCKKYSILTADTLSKNCSQCNEKSSCNTVSITSGLSEEQLNEVYNLFDVYAHPFTSGGQEIPLQEAKLTELITITNDYSCGIDSASEESGGIASKWEEYREFGSCFRKAAASATDLADQIEKVYKMRPSVKEKIGSKARKYVLDKYSTESIVKEFVQLISTAPKLTYKVSNTPPNEIWLKDTIQRIFGEVREDENYKNALFALNNGADRSQVEQEFTKAKIRQNPSAPDDYSLFFPLPCERYIAIDIDSGNYPLWRSVANIIAPKIKKHGIDLLFIGKDTSKISSGYVIDIQNPHCKKYVLDRADLVFSFSDIKIDKFYKLESIGWPKVLTFHSGPCPSDLADGIVDIASNFLAIPIDKTPSKAVFWGQNCESTVFEVIPDCLITNKYPGLNIYRLDKGGSAENIKVEDVDCCIVNHSSQLTDKVLSAKKLYIFIDDIPLLEIRHVLSAKTTLVCRDRAKLSDKRVEYIDYQVFDCPSKPHFLNTSDGEFYCESSRKVVSGGKEYNTFLSAKKDLTYTETFAIEEDESFWESQNFIKIFKKL